MIEKTKKYNWEKLTSYQQHTVLMYLYRCDTDFDGLETKYIETIRYRELKIKRSELPEIILHMTPSKLYMEAYKAIGEPMPCR